MKGVKQRKVTGTTTAASTSTSGTTSVIVSSNNNNTCAHLRKGLRVGSSSSSNNNSNSSTNKPLQLDINNNSIASELLQVSDNSIQPLDEVDQPSWFQSTFYYSGNNNSNSNINNNQRIKSDAKLYTAKVLTLLLVGFAAGLLYQLVLSSWSLYLWLPGIVNVTGKRVPVAAFVLADENEFLTDDLVKRLAAANQLQEAEIKLLRQQMQEAEEQRKLDEERIRQDQREEEASRLRLEEDARERRRREHMFQNQRYHEIYVPPLENNLSEQEYQERYHRQNPQATSTLMLRTRKSAEASVVGYIDQDTGQFVRGPPKLRGRNKKEPAQSDQPAS